MFYDVTKKELIYSDIFYKEVEFTDENNETHQGVDTYFLDNCDDETLRALNVARVVESEPIESDDKYKEVFKNERYDEEANTYYIDYELRDVSLDVAKAIKLNELAEIKSEKLASFEFKGKIYQIDESSKVNINGKISAILLSQNTEKPIQSVAWIAKDNTITQFSTAEFLAFSQAIANYIESVLFKHDELRTRVNSASSIDEIKGIEWIE